MFEAKVEVIFTVQQMKFAYNFILDGIKVVFLNGYLTSLRGIEIDKREATKYKIFQRAVGTWILIPCWRSIHSSYLHSNYSQQCSLFILFCNLVLRPYAGSLGCVCD